MRQFIRNAAVMAVILAAAGTALAGGKSGPKNSGSSGNSSQPISLYKNGSQNKSMNYSSKSPYCFKFSNCYCYRHGYWGWSSTCYSASYGCNLYYDPTTGEWYYWCPAQGCYLPVSLWNTYQP
jgi:hypothetical protein